MELIDYLKEEGVRRRRKSIFDILESDHPKEYEAFKELRDSYVTACIQDNISPFYDFCAQNIVEDLMNDSFYGRDSKLMALFNQDIQGDHVIDVGCNSGLKLVYYALNNPDKEFLGVDIATKSLAKAKKRAEKFELKNITFKEMDMQDLKSKKLFNTIISDHAIHESQAYNYNYYSFTPQFGTHLSSMRNILDEGGKILLSVAPEHVDGVRNRLAWDASFAGLKYNKEKETVFRFQRHGQIRNELYAHLDADHSF